MNPCWHVLVPVGRTSFTPGICVGSVTTETVAIALTVHAADVGVAEAYQRQIAQLGKTEAALVVTPCDVCSAPTGRFMDARLYCPDLLDTPPEAKPRPGEPPPELHIAGHRFVLNPDGLLVLHFDDGFGLLVRNGKPLGPSFPQFDGARCYGADGDGLVAVITGGDAGLIARVIRHARTSTTGPEGT